MVFFGGEGKRKEAASQSVKSAGKASSEITYDAGLVDKLKEEHRELIGILIAVRKAATEGRFNLVSDLLASFKHSFLNHVGLENVKLYVYMQQHGAQDADTLSSVSDVRKEMNEIARMVMKFIDTHIVESPSPVTVTDFHAQLDQAEAVLAKRIQIEENHLYPLYRAG